MLDLGWHPTERGIVGLEEALVAEDGVPMLGDHSILQQGLSGLEILEHFLRVRDLPTVVPKPARALVGHDGKHQNEEHQ